MAQHLKTWYTDHRDRDRPAPEGMEPVSTKLKGLNAKSQRTRLGYAIGVDYIDRQETSAVGGMMMHDSLTSASRAVNGCRGEALNVTVTSGHGTQSASLVVAMERAWLRQREAAHEAGRTLLSNAPGWTRV